MSYNGWSNYETWNVGLWIDNDQGTCCRRSEIVDEKLSEHDGNADAARYDTADALKDFVLDEVIEIDEMPASLASDLLGAALSEVNWSELAESYLTEAKERYSED
jgi:hypothetical protein